MDYRTYHNCLRVQVTPDGMQDERIENIAEHCARYGFDNVMLCINQEEFNVGHIPLEMAKPWVAVLKKAADAIRAKGLSVSINNWMEIGHCDRGCHWFEGQSFTPFVDMKGRVADNIACPLCDAWFDYFAEYATYLVRELDPDTYWIEDDFRLHNHAPLFGVGCYCERHMAMYNERLGTQYTREEFLEKAFAQGPINPERKVWLDVNRDTMLMLSDKLSRALHAAKPDIDIALMTSRPAAHCMEARDWDRLLGNLSQGGTRINRIHLPYGEIPPKEFMYQINSQSMGIRALSGDDVVIMPEIEHGSATLYAKTARYLRFTLEGSLPLVISGSTYSIYGFHANGARDSFGFGEVVRELQPYMQGVRDLDLDFARMAGVVVPIDEKACYHKTVQKDYTDLTATEYCAAGYLSALGIAFRYSQDKRFCGETVFMTGSNADFFTDEELKALFADNFVIGDATLARALEKRGLLSLISATGISDLSYENGEYSYEECADDITVICGVRKLRASARARCLPPCTAIRYTDDVTVLTTLHDYTMQVVAAGMVRGENFLVLPFAVDKNEYAMYDDLRRHFIMEAVAAQSNAYVIGNAIGVSTYLYEREDDRVLMLVNANVDVMEKPTVRVGNVPFTAVEKLGRDGSPVPCSFTREGDAITLEDTLDYMSSAVYVLK